MRALIQKIKDGRPRSGIMLTPGQVTDVVRRIVGSSHIKVLSKRSSVVDPDMICVGGFFDHQAEQDNEPCIELVLYYHPDQQHVDPANVDWDFLSFEIAETLGHEQVHRGQAHRKRKRIRGYVSKGKSKAEKEYLGNDDEIEAYGFSIAAEMLFLRNIAEIDDFRMGEIPVWNEYQYLFSDDQSVLLKLNRQILKYLRRLEVNDEKIGRAHV